MLINMLMASRLLYGMAQRGVLPGVFGRLGPRRTPWVAIAVHHGARRPAALHRRRPGRPVGHHGPAADRGVPAGQRARPCALRRDPVDHPHFRAPTVVLVLGAVVSLIFLLPIVREAVDLRAGPVAPPRRRRPVGHQLGLPPRPRALPEVIAPAPPANPDTFRPGWPTLPCPPFPIARAAPAWPQAPAATHTTPGRNPSPPPARRVRAASRRPGLARHPPTHQRNAPPPRTHRRPQARCRPMGLRARHRPPKARAPLARARTQRAAHAPPAAGLGPPSGPRATHRPPQARRRLAHRGATRPARTARRRPSTTRAPARNAPRTHRRPHGWVPPSSPRATHRARTADRTAGSHPGGPRATHRPPQARRRLAHRGVAPRSRRPPLDRVPAPRPTGLPLVGPSRWAGDRPRNARLACPLRLAASAPSVVDRLHRVDRVGLGGRLVVAVAQHPREPQRHPARIARAASAPRRRRSPRPARAGRVTTQSPRSTASSWNRSVCQRSSSSVSPLNVLPSMTNPPVRGSRAPRCRLDSQPRAPAAAPTRRPAPPGRACAAA